MEKKPRSYGNGSIYKTSDQRWVVKVSLGSGPDGKPLTKRFSARTKAEAERKLRAFKNEQQRQETSSPVHFTVQDYFEYWLKTYQFQKLKPLSYDCLEGSVQNLFQRLQIQRCQRYVLLQLGNHQMILMLADIELSFGLVVLQVIVFQLRLMPIHRNDLVGKMCRINAATMRHVLHQIAQLFTDMLKFVDSCLYYAPLFLYNGGRKFAAQEIFYDSIFFHASQ